MMNKKWNVIIVTLFITLIVWVIWLIITKYMINLLQISSENYKYYKSYYIAYAWIELALWKNKNHGMWFNDVVNTGSATISKNFSWLNYNFSVKDISEAKYITSNPKSLINTWTNYCADKKNWILVKQWEWVLLPLVYDKNTWEWPFSWLNYNSLDINFSETKLNRSGNGMFVSYQSTDDKIIKSLSMWWNNNSNLASFTFPSTSSSNKPFLIVWSKSWTWYFCISSSKEMVTPYVNIVSKWSFMDRSVVLNLVKYNKWANFTMYWIY